MATKQGMCKNCGSLVMFDDRDDLCECVFCNCVFPSKEAMEILENPNNYEFKNEKFEKQEGTRHYYSNPVMPDVVEKAVKRDITSKSQSDSAKLKANEFVIGMAVGAVAIVAIIVAIALPMFLSRKSLTDAITADFDKVFDSTSESNYEYKQFDIYGLSCQYVKVGVSGDMTEGDAQQIYSNYVALRSDKRGDASGDVEMYIYTPDTIYFISKDGLTKDVQEPLEIIETTEETK